MKRIFFSALALTMIVTGCTSLKMAVSDDLKPAYDEYNVKGRQGILIKQKMSFGEFSTNTVHRSWTKGNSMKFGLGYITGEQQEWVNIISTEYINRKQTLRYQLSDGPNRSQVFAVSRFNSKDLEIGKNTNSVLNIGMDIFGIGYKSSSMFYVQIFASEKDSRPWEMAIDNEASQATPKKYIGYLAKGKNDYYSIVPVTKAEVNGKTGNTLAGSIGFEFRNKEGKVVAAVSLVDKGMVYMGRTTADERFLLANACTALLLQEQIGD